MAQEYRRHTMKDLRDAFKEAGYPIADSWIRRQIRKGNLILPRSTTHFAKFYIKGENRKEGFVYEMTMTQIQNVVKAFLPGGVGYYDYKKESSE